MQRKRDGLVPVQKIRDASPQALHYFTQADQVNQLVGASEADPDRGFMARMMVLCSLPRTNPGTQQQYKRVNGPYRLYMQAGPETKLPFGNLPRLILAWLCTEVVKTQNRELVLGKSLSEFMRTLGVYSSDGLRIAVFVRVVPWRVRIVLPGATRCRSTRPRVALS